MKTKQLNIKKMNMKYFFRTGILTLFTGLIFAACSDDDDIPPPINEEELITTMEVVLSPQNFGQVVTLSYRDLDGDGPSEPVVENGVLTTNTTYTGIITLLNESVEPAEDITLEVEEEGAEHQFFYNNDFGAESLYLDQDENGNPIGLQFELTTTDSANGSFTVILRHEPNKNASGVSEGNIENAGGETDISVTFGVEVQ